MIDDSRTLVWVSYVTLWLLLVVATAVMTAIAGPNGISAELFCVAAAAYVACGRVRLAAGMVAGAAVAGALAMVLAQFTAVWHYIADVAWAIPVLYAAGAGVGLVMGKALTRGESYSRAYLTVAVLASTVALALLLSTWDFQRAQFNKAIEFFQWILGDVPEAERTAVMEPLSLLKDNWSAMVPGGLVALVCMRFALWLTVLSWLLRKWRSVGLSTPFRSLRMPDWLVWIGILAGILWLFDQHGTPAPWVRITAWNTLLVLVRLYWLVGLAVAVYLIGRFPRRPLLIFSVVLLFISCGHLFVVIGLLDTWADFRGKLDRAIEAQKSGNTPDDPS